MGRVAGLKPEDTRRRVIDGAAEAFADLGYERARVTDIAKAAGLSSGAMYNHFESKAGLLAAVVEDHACDHLLDWAGPTEGGAGLLDLVLEQARRLAADDRPETPLLIEAVTAARRDPDVLAVLSSQVAEREDVVTQVIALAQATGDAAGGLDPRAAARFMLMAHLGSVLVRAMDLPAIEADAWDAFVTRLIDGFRPTEDR
mgnify:CR=1 FL=1